MFKTPVALIVFRRPDLTAKVIESLRAVKPTDVYVIADGPRQGNAAEAEACEQTRGVIETIDWDCRIHRNYADANMGCGHRPPSGLDWLFGQVESAIILEDDCIPHPSFFTFCEEMLERYRNDERVMHVSGCTYRPEPWDTEHSYFFSKHPGCWGWATWRRAWQYYDAHCDRWEQLRETSFLPDAVGDDDVAAYYGKLFDEILVSHPWYSTWDYQWSFACWANSGLAITPRHNLISNIGAGEQATHTKAEGMSTMFLPFAEMPRPLSHPPEVRCDVDLDRRFVEELLVPLAKWEHPDGGGLRGMIARALPGAMKQRIKQMFC